MKIKILETFSIKKKNFVFYRFFLTFLMFNVQEDTRNNKSIESGLNAANCIKYQQQ